MIKASGSRREQAVERTVADRRATAERRLDLLVAAAYRLLDQGEDLTIRRLLAASRQSLVTYHQHFGDRQGLLAYLLAHGYDRLSVALTQQAQQQNDPQRALRAAVLLLLDVSRGPRSPRCRALADLDEELLREHPDLHNQAQASLLEVLDRLVEAARPSIPDPRRNTLVVLTLLRAVVAMEPALEALGTGAATDHDLWAVVRGALELPPAALSSPPTSSQEGDVEHRQRRPSVGNVLTERVAVLDAVPGAAPARRLRLRGAPQET